MPLVEISNERGLSDEGIFIKPDSLEAKFFSKTYLQIIKNIYQFQVQ